MAEFCRSTLTATIVKARFHDREDIWVTDRGSHLYSEELGGINNLCNYLRGNEAVPRRYIDVGAGITKGARELAQGSLTDFEVYAAVLSPSLVRGHQVLLDTIAPITVVPRSVERLDTVFPRDHFALLTSVYGITYSRFPEKAVEVMDHILAPGGAIKMKTHYTVMDRPPFGLDCYGTEIYAKLLVDRGYDVATCKQILLALKQNTTGLTKTAEELLYQDREDRNDQRLLEIDKDTSPIISWSKDTQI